MQLRQHAVLSTHIMSSLDLAAKRGTAQHHVTVTQRNQIGQVGMAAGKLRDANSAGGVGKMTTQERFEPGQIEFFSGSYRTWMVAKVGHVRLVNFPALHTTCAWTPMLSVRQQRDVVQMRKGVK